VVLTWPYADTTLCYRICPAALLCLSDCALEFGNLDFTRRRDPERLRFEPNQKGH
jgi:hypothetical protein